jgi:hypothetical protein
VSDPAFHDAKSIWRNQETEGTTVTLEDIKSRADKFQKRIRNRNLREYIASVFVIAAFGFVAWHMHGWMIRLGGATIIAATLFVMWQLHRRGRANAVPDGATAGGLLAFHRAQLVRQRDAVRSVWLWYLAPFVPGLALISLGRYFQNHVPGRPLAQDHAIIIFSGIIMVLVFFIILLLNLWGAARLQNRIHELDKLRAE